MNIPCDCRATNWASKDSRRKGRFNPSGRIVTFGDETRLNPVHWQEDGEKVMSARLMMGFNVGTVTRWSMADVVENVKRIRHRQGAVIDATFLAQQGMYTSSESGQETEEPGAQVIFINLSYYHVRDALFQIQMVELAEELCVKLEQESIILEIQRGGIVSKVGTVTPSPAFGHPLGEGGRGEGGLGS